MSWPRYTIMLLACLTIQGSALSQTRFAEPVRENWGLVEYTDQQGTFIREYVWQDIDSDGHFDVTLQQESIWCMPFFPDLFPCILLPSPIVYLGDINNQFELVDNSETTRYNFVLSNSYDSKPVDIDLDGDLDQILMIEDEATPNAYRRFLIAREWFVDSTGYYSSKRRDTLEIPSCIDHESTIISYSWNLVDLNNDSLSDLIIFSDKVDSSNMRTLEAIFYPFKLERQSYIPFGEALSGLDTSYISSPFNLAAVFSTLESSDLQLKHTMFADADQDEDSDLFLVTCKPDSNNNCGVIELYLVYNIGVSTPYFNPGVHLVYRFSDFFNNSVITSDFDHISRTVKLVDIDYDSDLDIIYNEASNPTDYLGYSPDYDLYNVLYFIENKSETITSEMSQQTKLFHLFPNPSSSSINLEIPKTSDLYFKLSIYDTFGHLIYQNRVNSGNNKLELSHLIDGVYLVFVENEEGFDCQRILIQR